MRSERNFVWIDLEMTGLEVEKDSILEIATIITDGQLNVIAQGPCLVIQHDDQVLNNMDPWVTKTHGKSGLTQKARESNITMGQAEQETLAFIKEHCSIHNALLAGNSVWQDRVFLRKYMPSIVDYLNYRLIDVTSIKELVKAWYPDNALKDFKKPENHRALEDIQSSIDELRHYKTHFFKE